MTLAAFLTLVLLIPAADNSFPTSGHSPAHGQAAGAIAGSFCTKT